VHIFKYVARERGRNGGRDVARKLGGSAAERGRAGEHRARRNQRLLGGGERNAERERIGVGIRALVEAVDGARVAGAARAARREGGQHWEVEQAVGAGGRGAVEGHVGRGAGRLVVAGGFEVDAHLASSGAGAVAAHYGAVAEDGVLADNRVGHGRVGGAVGR
nr:hypothetical protein [Tanacetum cinerariifolium]